MAQKTIKIGNHTIDVWNQSFRVNNSPLAFLDPKTPEKFAEQLMVVMEAYRKEENSKRFATFLKENLSEFFGNVGSTVTPNQPR